MKKQLLAFITLILFLSPVLAKDYELGTLISGVVDKVLVKAGEKVKKGQILLQLDQSTLEAELKKAEKLSISASLDKKEAKKELVRAEELYERTVLSDHELNVAKVNHAKIDALAASAESDLAFAKYQLKYSQITSPINGKVKKVNSWVGMVVNNARQNTVLLVVSK